MSAWLSVVAPVASVLWSSINGARALAVRAGWITPQKIAPMVLSVGNLQAGGTGKTPVVAWVARQILAQNLSVAILTRGYGGARESTGGVISPRTDAVDPAEWGDEAALLAQLVPEAWIGVGGDRRKSIDEILAHSHVDWVVLDDGFQNHQLYVDLKILLLSTVSRPKVFRDFAFRARAADLILWTKGESAPETYAKPLCRVLLEPDSAEIALLERAFLVCALADPTPLVEILGPRLIQKEIFPDHHPYSQSEVEHFMSAAQSRGLSLVTTGKDWVKIQKYLSPADKMRWTVLEPQVKVLWGLDAWEKVVGRKILARKKR